MSDPVVVFASFVPRAENREDFLALMQQMVEHTRAEPGCETYDLYEAAGDQPSVHLFERYRDQGALEAHRATDHYKSYRAEAPDMLSEPIGVLVLSAIDAAAG